jgi:hypothetical protein
MWADAVVVTTPNLDHNASFLATAEPLEAQALISELAIKAFISAVLPGLAGIDVRGVDAGLDEPLENRAADERSTSQPDGAAVALSLFRTLRAAAFRAVNARVSLGIARLLRRG